MVAGRGHGHLGSAYNERYADVLFVHLCLAISQTVLTQVVAVVGSEDDIGIFRVGPAQQVC